MKDIRTAEKLILLCCYTSTIDIYDAYYAILLICGSGGKVAFSGFLLTFRFKHKIIKTCRQLLTVVGTNLSDLFG
jgi:hypothetical protein